MVISELGGGARKEREQSWQRIAEQRVLWRAVVRKWVKADRAKDHKQCWKVKHAPGGKRDQTLARQQARLTAITGVTFDANGQAVCPHCEQDGVLVRWHSRQLAARILPCRSRNSEQRHKAAAGRRMRA
eukprot:1717044-Pyramimonas_sp.AAC.2